jgi:D-tyrosyl-tRNA(Tyr) deacylase
LIEQLTAALRAEGLTVETGRFGTYMHVESVNDGPICILLDSRRTF